MRLLRAIPVALAALGLSGVASATSKPTNSEIKKAVRAAERSSDLWATVNVCNTRRHPHELGLRAQMPALGFSSNLYMTFEVYYRSGGRFRADPATTQRVSLGSQSGSTVHQAGVTFTFTPPAVLEGRVLFAWRRDGRVIGRAERMTTAHHMHVDFGDPRGHSGAGCTIR